MEKRVLHVLNSCAYSGAENVVITVIEKLKDDFTFAYASKDGPIRDILEEKKIPFFPLKNRGIVDIGRVVRCFKPDILHAHDLTASILCGGVCIGTPVLSHLHSNAPWMRTFNPVSVAYYLSSIRYRKILTVSNSIMREYVFGTNLIKKSAIIYNPIDIKSIREKAECVKQDNIPSYDIAFMGSFLPCKNIPRFLKIIAALKKKIPHIQAVIIGTGDYREQYYGMIKEAELTNNITCTGFLQNPYKILALSKVLCVTSLWEGFGLAAAEAMVLGVPVVASAVGGLTELVDDSCGMLCETDEAFEGEILRLLSEKSYREQKAIGACNKAEEIFNIKAYMQTLKEIYKNIFYDTRI